MKLNREIVRLVGEKPMISAKLDDVNCKCLWDTGSQVSIMTDEFLHNNFPHKTLHTVDEFLQNDTKLNLTAANNTDVPIEGVVLFEFSIDEVTCSVPFLITKDKLSQTIVGFNVMQHLVVNYKNDAKLLPSLTKILPNLSCENVELMVQTIEKASEVSDVLGTVKTVKSVIIPPNCLVNVKCKTKVSVDKSETDVLIQPSVDFMGDATGIW